MQPVRYSNKQRKEYIQELKDAEFDLLVIGGGITGAGIALDASLRGLKVALVELKDFAWGTSSRSTKLVHGGLRYLKQFELGLVREVGTERAIVHRNARHVVLPERMLLPIVEGGSLGKFMSSIGLWVYDWLANVDKQERRRMLSKSKTAELEPLLRKDILKGGGLYYEYRTDDARLTMEIIKTAVAQGAICLNYLKAVDFTYDDKGSITATVVVDVPTGERFAIKSKTQVNAAGPWVDDVRGLDDYPVRGKHLFLTKGVHLVVPFDKLPLEQAVYFDVLEDNRMCFAIPRDTITYIGTTDTAYKADIANPKAELSDVKYILAATNRMFPTANLELKDVESTWAGLRPLIHEEGKSPSDISRKDEIFMAKSGLISIAGGKLTGYRKMAERTTDKVCERLGQKLACKTAEQILGGGDFDSNEALQDFIVQRIGEVKQVLIPAQKIKSWTYRYGRDTDWIIARAFELYNKVEDPERRTELAELQYCIAHEAVYRLNDYLVRRTGRLYFDLARLQKQYLWIAELMGAELNWDEARLQEEISAFERSIHEVLAFKEELHSSS